MYLDYRGQRISGAFRTETCGKISPGRNIPVFFNLGDMNLIGPRPALYNQEDLMEERDKYGANFVRPGITGLAQVMGRDELPIDVKARYDGIYTQYVGPVVDLFSLIRTIAVVVTSDGVVEGGTGAMEMEKSGQKTDITSESGDFL